MNAAPLSFQSVRFGSGLSTSLGLPVLVAFTSPLIRISVVLAAIRATPFLHLMLLAHHLLTSWLHEREDINGYRCAFRFCQHYRWHQSMMLYCHRGHQGLFGIWLLKPHFYA